MPPAAPGRPLPRALNCSREVIERGAELCGLTLEELWQQTLDAMRSCEDSINRQMEEI